MRIDIKAKHERVSRRGAKAFRFVFDFLIEFKIFVCHKLDGFFLINHRTTFVVRRLLHLRLPTSSRINFPCRRSFMSFSDIKLSARVAAFSFAATFNQMSRDSRAMLFSYSWGGRNFINFAARSSSSSSKQNKLALGIGVELNKRIRIMNSDKNAVNLTNKEENFFNKSFRCVARCLLFCSDINITAKTKTKVYLKLVALARLCLISSAFFDFWVMSSL